MTTQSNKQSQNVKVVINNNTPAPPRRRRRKPPSPPPAEAEAPYAPTKDFARGVAPYANRPMTYAPSVQLIQTDNGGRIPPYFEHQLTNQATTIEQMRRQMEDELVGVREEMYGFARDPEEIARIDRNIEELRGQLGGLMQPAQPPASPIAPPAPPAQPAPPPQPAPPQPPIQIPIIPHAPPQVFEPQPMNPPMYNMNMPPMNRLFVNDPVAWPVLPPIRVRPPNWNIDAILPPMEEDMPDAGLQPQSPIDAQMADEPIPPQQQPYNPLQLPAPQQPNQQPPPPPQPQQPPPQQPPEPRVYRRIEYERARDRVVSLFLQRSGVHSKKERAEIREKILLAGRMVGIDSNNIATVRRKLERIVKGHAI